MHQKDEKNGLDTTFVHQSSFRGLGVSSLSCNQPTPKTSNKTLNSLTQPNISHAQSHIQQVKCKQISSQARIKVLVENSL
jgi:hypothetical protein